MRHVVEARHADRVEGIAAAQVTVWFTIGPSAVWAMAGRVSSKSAALASQCRWRRLARRAEGDRTRRRVSVKLS